MVVSTYITLYVHDFFSFFFFLKKNEVIVNLCNVGNFLDKYILKLIVWLYNCIILYKYL